MNVTVTVPENGIGGTYYRRSDIGTTKIAAIAGRKWVWQTEISGLAVPIVMVCKYGQVLNIDQTIKAIQQALLNCAESNPRSWN